MRNKIACSITKEVRCDENIKNMIKRHTRRGGIIIVIINQRDNKKIDPHKLV